MIAMQMPDLTSYIHTAASFISRRDPNNATNYLGLASEEIKVLIQKRGGYDDQIRQLSREIHTLNQKVSELYRKQEQQRMQSQHHVAVTTKTLFPIRVTYDAGLGNTIELRGTKEAGLSWEQGKALICKDTTHWELDLDYRGPFEYKLVLRKPDDTIVWENLEENKNRVFSTDDKTVVNYLNPIIPVFDPI